MTIPADTNSPSLPNHLDASKPLPPLRVPNLSGIRQHENSRLRNVAMAMMFVIFIVTGAIAGMRWYVSHDDDSVAVPQPVVTSEPHPPRTRLGRLTPNAVVAPHDSSPNPIASAAPDPIAPSAPKASRVATGTAKLNRSAADPRPLIPGDPVQVSSPWSKHSSDSRSAGALRKSSGALRKPGDNKSLHTPSDAHVPLVPD